MTNKGDKAMGERCILGVQVGITSGSAAICDGEVVFAVSEERFTKAKNETLFPVRAIQETLSYLKNNGYPEPELAVIPSENMDVDHYLMRRECTFSIADYVKEQHAYWRERLYHGNNVQYRDIFPGKFSNALLNDLQLLRLRESSDLKAEWKKVRAELVRSISGIQQVEYVNHEKAHAAYGLYGSPLKKDETVVFAVDGFGDDANCSVWTWEADRLVCHKKYRNFNVGRLYRYITLFLGMKPNEHEYKVMGLAPYTKYESIKQAYTIFADAWSFDRNSGEVISQEKPTDMYFYFKEKLEGIRFDIIAAALQEYTENMLLELVQYWAKLLNKKRVALSGGVSLNIKANMLIGELEEIEEVFVAASGGDESLCIGAAFAYLDAAGKGSFIHSVPHMYLGTEYEQNVIDEKIAAFLAANSKFSCMFNVTNKIIARELAEGKIVGRFCGRMEFGARALGNRSILANPSLKDVVKKINFQIKHRDFWMPFTPSMIDYRAQDYLINPKGHKFPYMTIASKTSTAAQSEIGGALHPADLTARPQIVTLQTNPQYWDLINEFCLLTGIGALLNTSLNLSGLPICESPEDVFYLLLNSDLDIAVLGSTMIARTA